MGSIHVRIAFVLASLSLASASTLPTAAEARQLSLYRAIFFDAPGAPNDLFVDYGTTSDSALLLTSGLDVAAIPHHIDFLDTESEVYGTADCSGLVGGTVGYGHISGTLSGTTTSNAGEVWNYTDFRGSFVDTVIIHAPVPALSQTWGTFTAAVLVEVDPSLTAIGPNGPPNEEAYAEVGWGLSTGVVIGSATFQDSDEAEPSSFYSIINQQPASPAPTSVLVPIVMSFQFDVPFDLTLEFYAYGRSWARGFAGPSFPAPHATAVASEPFLNSVSWQGISSVRDALDAEVTGWSITADSQTNYASAVPEPTLGSLSAGGIVGLAGLVRISRRRADRAGGLR